MDDRIANLQPVLVIKPEWQVAVPPGACCKGLKYKCGPNISHIRTLLQLCFPCEFMRTRA